jgi:uncharacterized membrane protein YeaQ/YmgE (transglycosylase-associated protein family)
MVISALVVELLPIAIIETKLREKIMSLPTLILGFILSTLYGALFHLWKGGNAGRLLLYLILAWVGFWVGQFVGNLFNLTIDTLGQLHLLAATLGSIILLAIGYWLSLVQVDRKTK